MVQITNNLLCQKVNVVHTHAHNGHLVNWVTIALQNITNILKKIHLKQYKNIKFSLIHVIGGIFFQNWFLINDHLLDQPSDDLDDDVSEIIESKNIDVYDATLNKQETKIHF